MGYNKVKLEWETTYKLKGFLREFGVTLALAVVIFILLQAVISNVVVISSSMEPSLDIGQRLIINKVAYRFHEPERGDIIVFRLDDSKVEYIKRIIGLPGETVEIKEETIYINGSKLDEPYIEDPPMYTLSQRKIEEGSYFVLGDNRNNSNDSHNDWTVPRQNIIGKAWLSIWPLSDWGLIPDYSYQSG